MHSSRESAGSNLCLDFDPPCRFGVESDRSRPRCWPLVKVEIPVVAPFKAYVRNAASTARLKARVKRCQT